jgi:hypothetical protein
MASTKADGNRVSWTYTANDSEAYRVSAKAVYVLDGTDGAKYGGSAAAASLKPKPAGLRMRQVYAVTAAGKTIAITCYTAACDAFATAGTTLTRNINGTDTSVTTTGDTRPEKSGRQTKQSS